jgi:hypothetical protein
VARHDYRCPACRRVLRDQYRTLDQGGLHTAPRCPACTTQMEWLPPRLAWDLKTDGGGTAGFQKFTTYDGLNRKVEIDSLHKLRQVEAESEKLAADGIGQPIRFRAYAQDRSNMGVNTFGDGPPEKLDPSAKRRFGLQGAASQVQPGPDGADPEYSYGPGVDDSNTSALQIDE